MAASYLCLLSDISIDVDVLHLWKVFPVLKTAEINTNYVTTWANVLFIFFAP